MSSLMENILYASQCEKLNTFLDNSKTFLTTSGFRKSWNTENISMTASLQRANSRTIPKLSENDLQGTDWHCHFEGCI